MNVFVLEPQSCQVNDSSALSVGSLNLRIYGCAQVVHMHIGGTHQFNFQQTFNFSKSIFLQNNTCQSVIKILIWVLFVRFLCLINKIRSLAIAGLADVLADFIRRKSEI